MFKYGNDKGKLMNIGAFNLPTQHVTIESGGYFEPIKNYLIDYNIIAENRLPVEDVIHCRYPALDPINGRNLMGISPLSVAANIVITQNSGQDQLASLYTAGQPKGLLSRQIEGNPAAIAGDGEIKGHKDAWRKAAKKGEHLYGYGKYEWLKLGFDNVRDMMILEQSISGLRSLCNIYGVPSILFNDSVGTTFSNRKEAREEMWINRIKPDQLLFCEKLNQKIKYAYPEYEVWPDYSSVPELQTSKKEQIESYLAGLREGIFTPNEVRKYGYEIEEIEDELLNTRYISVGKMPLSEVNNTDPEQVLNSKGIDHYLYGQK